MMTHSKQQTSIREDVLTNLLANMPGYLHWKDRQGVYLGCNHSHAQP